ncbi:ATP-binding cassette domain-containing protein [Micromonospora sp. S-DT3-3-22]|uniref:ATP-binding cassette domain-containing protein n=1 Tax=Micromonospora sp. S-DT3-3-22 TaxID=2755359 RepID=UPI00188E773C|nr:ATP-binding cassette domain-containing protein [Micromonospora sp. S-DT3-3-22]
MTAYNVLSEGTMAEPIVVAEGLRKSFGGTHALQGLDLAVPEGTVCGVLGPNGAGKTTAVRILATLSDPDAGHARVAGYDVVREAGRVRERIGLAGQHAAVDEKLTGRSNLRMFGRLYHLSRRAAHQRADELLDRFGLMDAADRPVAGYSGGMRRRLDLIASLILRPTVLFLDEPTTGLDPRSRGEIWASIRELVADGTTVLLTTQYLDEADQLADDIAVIDHGRVIATGTPDELKSTIGDRLELITETPAMLPLAATVLGNLTGSEVTTTETDRLSVALPATGLRLADIVRELDQAGIAAADVSVRRPTLDEVFLRLTDRKEAVR